MSYKQTIRTAFLFTLPATLAMTGCGSEPPTAAPAPEVISGVAVLTVEQQTMPDIFEAVGTVRAAQTSQVASQLLADIVEIHVREGDRVQKGQVLVVLDDSGPRAAVSRARAAQAAAEKEVATAQAEFTLAEATFRRFETLYERKSVSPQEFDEAKARYESAAARRESAQAGREQAQAALEEAEVRLRHTRLRAPFAGRITEKHADPGTLATPGMVLLVIEDTRSFRLDVSVDESDIGYVREGQTVPVAVDALGAKELPGRVREIVPAADPASRSFLVKIELPADRGFRSGLFGRARFSRGERRGVLVPQSAVVRRGQLDGVYVVGEDGLAQLRYVTLGKPYDPRVEVLSGLEPSERIVAAPGEQELAGKRVAEDGR